MRAATTGKAPRWRNRFEPGWRERRKRAAVTPPHDRDRLKVLVVAAWYPSPQTPVSGVFVKEQALAAQLHHDVVVLHPMVAPHRIRGLYELTESVEDGILTLRLLCRRVLGEKLSLVVAMIGRRAVTRRLAAEGFRPNVIHAHVFWAGVIGSYLGRFYGAPTILTEHHTGFPTKTIRGVARVVARFALRRADLVCPVSRDLERHIRAFGVSNRFEVVPNVVDTSLFAPARAASALSRQACTRVLFVGAQVDRKGVPQLLEAFRAVLHRRENMDLDIVGDGPERGRYEAIATSLGLAEAVRFHGNKSKAEVASLMRDACFVVLPSLSENLPCVLLEALASGLPLVATDVGGVTEIVDEDVGLVIPPNDIPALSAALEAMADSAIEYDPQILASQARARYGREEVGRAWDRVYRKIVAQHNDRSAGTRSRS
jgi:glycosyltransferase involved in cell wall biosynthesis